jgi:acylphosphatase
MPNKLLRIHGLVQGVGYRESMRREAERLRLSGWVRNRRDGTVEALVCGSAEQVEQMLAWAGQGPRSAMVQRVVVTDMAAAAMGTFEILFTE